MSTIEEKRARALALQQAIADEKAAREAAAVEAQAIVEEQILDAEIQRLEAHLADEQGFTASLVDSVVASNRAPEPVVPVQADEVSEPDVEVVVPDLPPATGNETDFFESLNGEGGN